MFFYACVLIVIDITLWTCIPFIRTKKTITLQSSVNLSPPSPPESDQLQNTLNLLLQPEILIPIIISSIFVLILIIILFTYCTQERASAIGNVIRSIRGKPPIDTNKKTEKEPQILYVDPDNGQQEFY